MRPCRVCGVALTAENSWPKGWARRIYICKQCDYAEHNARRQRNIGVAHAREQAYRETHQEERREQAARYRERHREEIREKSRERYRANADRINQVRKAWCLALKCEVMSHYSRGEPHCAHCGYSDLRALTMDHVDGGGSAHRRQINGGGARMYNWLRANGYPEGYQVLCMNCQFIKKLENGEHRWQDPLEESP